MSYPLATATPLFSGGVAGLILTILWANAVNVSNVHAPTSEVKFISVGLGHVAFMPVGICISKSFVYPNDIYNFEAFESLRALYPIPVNFNVSVNPVVTAAIICLIFLFTVPHISGDVE